MTELNPYSPPKANVSSARSRSAVFAMADSPRFALLAGWTMLLGSLLALATMVPIALQSSGWVNMVLLLFIALLYIWGALCGFAALKRAPEWKQFAGWFWLAQAPLLQTTALSYYASCGVGAWLIVRFPTSSVTFEANAHMGSIFRWSFAQPVPEVHVGVNALAAVVAFVLLRQRPQVTPDRSPREA